MFLKCKHSSRFAGKLKLLLYQHGLYIGAVQPQYMRYMHILTTGSTTVRVVVTRYEMNTCKMSMVKTSKLVTLQSPTSASWFSGQVRPSTTSLKLFNNRHTSPLLAKILHTRTLLHDSVHCHNSNMDTHLSTLQQARQVCGQLLQAWTRTNPKAV